ncbi:hypothetical protein [Burkholderia sp. MBR-1]|uniref:hypothetical protein n=1 Tax=Burkholderia sp. MBR-1 TaxID=2732364 RepID=UPI0015EEE09C|nr:hypothetical protein [Burkholderia sp. MBR-1]
MQRYSIRHVSRAVFAGILIAGLAAGAGCQKKSETDTGAGATSDASAVGGMSPAPSTVPSGTPSSGAAGADSGTAGTTGGAASMPGAASGTTGASGG